MQKMFRHPFKYTGYTYEGIWKSQTKHWLRQKLHQLERREIRRELRV